MIESIIITEDVQGRYLGIFIEELLHSFMVEDYANYKMNAHRKEREISKMATPTLCSR